MLKHVLILSLTLLLGMSLRSLAQPEQTNAERFANRIIERLARRDVSVTDEQKLALQVAHPVLVAYAEHAYQYSPLSYLQAFWIYARQDARSEISMSDATEMILSGRIGSVDHFHDGWAELATFDGEQYKTRDPETKLFEIVASVDPKRVFIRTGTE